MKNKLHFLGTGEAFDDKRPNTSLLLEGAVNVLFDCGYSIPHHLWAVSTDPEFVSIIYLSHQHGDHSMGIPPLWIRALEDGRISPFKVIVPEQITAVIQGVSELVYPGFFEKYGHTMEFVELASGEKYEQDGLTFEVCETDHSVRNNAVKVTMPSGFQFAYSGDGHPTKKTRKLFEGCDLLIQETFFLDQPRHGHSAVEPVVMLANDLKIKKLALLHISRHICDIVGFELQKLSPDFEVWVPRPGEVLEIDEY